MSQKSRSSSPNHLSNQELPLFEETQDTSSTRQISLVERLELNVPSSRVSSNAIILGNIDNDPLDVRKYQFFNPNPIFQNLSLTSDHPGY